MPRWVCHSGLQRRVSGYFAGMLRFWLFSILLVVRMSCADRVLGQADSWTGGGRVAFVSRAPLELIEAASRSLRGALQPASRSFAFTLPVNSFEGFNSDIQRTHFLENYMEQKKYPSATFSGKIIEDVPFSTIGTYTVRAKGNLTIHGIARERIIRGTLVITEKEVVVTADFPVPLSDHGITIPKIVSQKISEDVAVTVQVRFPKSGGS